MAESLPCLLDGCDRPIGRKGKKWCSPSHRTKGYLVKKAAKRAEAEERAREDKGQRAERRKARKSWMAQDPLALFDYLPVQERKALLLEAAYSLKRLKEGGLSCAHSQGPGSSWGL